MGATGHGNFSNLPLTPGHMYVEFDTYDINDIPVLMFPRRRFPLRQDSTTTTTTPSPLTMLTVPPVVENKQSQMQYGPNDAYHRLGSGYAFFKIHFFN